MPWPRSFAAVRNSALELTGDGWLMFVDADEWLTEQTAATLRESLRGYESIDGIEWCTLAPVIREDGAGQQYNDIARIMPARHLRYTGEVHEYPYLPAHPEVVPGLLGVDLTFRHDGYSPEVVRDKDKAARNLELLGLARHREPQNPRWLYYHLRDGLHLLDEDGVLARLADVESASRRGFGDRYPPEVYRVNSLVRACVRLAELAAWPRLLDICVDLDRSRPDGAHPDAVYFRGVYELLHGAGPDSDQLLRAIRLRRDETVVAASGLDPDGRPLDALIAAQLRELKGRDAANAYLKMCRPWTDQFFDASRLR